MSSQNNTAPQAPQRRIPPTIFPLLHPNGRTYSLTPKNRGYLTYLDSLTPRSRAQGIEELKIQNNLALYKTKPDSISLHRLNRPTPFFTYFEYGTRVGDLRLRFRDLVR